MGILPDLRGMFLGRDVHTTGHGQDSILGQRNKMVRVRFKYIFYLKKKTLLIFKIETDSLVLV